ncbi:ariadne RING finger [Ampelomyces quisqualis]|uniref:RBR-type E3 ubiquitin transferase n=1 Tax=Ampelomyces quisqualis TaxID=50730 RepID=A0A6A5QLV7_AMPQU|nr:ariadne RING finger [Ampelomyces quisqualis]
MSTVTGTVAAQSVIDVSEDETEAGPSMTFAERQGNAIQKLSMEYQCVACTDCQPRTHMVTAKCGHRYCANCAKGLFMRSTKDETYFPPKCCKQPIPLAFVERHMNADEIAIFQLATIEYETKKRTYCSNLSCGSFIPPDRIEAGSQRATCSRCGTETCSSCLNRYHQNSECPDDGALRETLNLAKEMGWQICQTCNRVVQLRSGCNHMTCICKAEFCYVCGVDWKNCDCPPADIDRIEERAEEIVERDAPQGMLAHERRDRLDQVFAQLQDAHECEHSRRFQRVFDSKPRRGFRCELCDARHHKYILQCRRCYVNVCEDCRRNRI